MTKEQLKALLVEIVELGHSIERLDAPGNEHWTPKYRSLIKRVHDAISEPDEPKAPRELWLNGWHRQGDTVLYGNGIHCAGCGRFGGCVTVDLSGLPPDYVAPPEPRWP